MKHYVDIEVLPDAEFSPVDLMNALFAKLHRVLGQHGKGRVGISFPSYAKTLGRKLRLHGSAEELQTLLELPWQQGMRDYTKISHILAVPDNCQYRTVKRVQAKSVHNKEKRAKAMRNAAEAWRSSEEKRQVMPTFTQKTLELPYAELMSLSTQSRMRVWVEHGALQAEEKGGAFNSYGLSSEATIPWF